ncbi:hypothetical protein KAR91_25530 [Candidatus Pacearchaeota archaeon]|nr:hypothetical protein [Candidatus Pacearchaeota archaeon]
MEFNEEQAKEIGLSEEQVTKVKELTNSNEADLKKEWDGKANTDAEKIIQGAADKVETLTGIKREQGVKIAEYLGLASENYLKGGKSALEQKQAELQKKINEGGGDKTLKAELETANGLIDGYKQTEAKYADYEKNDYKGKWEQANKDLDSQTEDIAFGSIKPSFPDTVNAYEAKGRWNEFKKDTLSKYHIKKVDNEWVGVDKENEYKIVKLEQLVKDNNVISELSKGRDAKGLGIKKDIQIADVPFKIPENATAKERQKAIKDYLVDVRKLSALSDKYTKEYAALNKKLLEKKPVT